MGPDKEVEINSEWEYATQYCQGGARNDNIFQQPNHFNFVAATAQHEYIPAGTRRKRD
jgi:hypothetical protein